MVRRNRTRFRTPADGSQFARYVGPEALHDAHIVRVERLSDTPDVPVCPRGIRRWRTDSPEVRRGSGGALASPDGMIVYAIVGGRTPEELPSNARKE